MTNNHHLRIGLGVGAVLLLSFAYLLHAVIQAQSNAPVSEQELVQVQPSTPTVYQPIAEDQLALATIPWSRKSEASWQVEISEATLPTFPKLRNPSEPERVWLNLARVPELKKKP